MRHDRGVLPNRFFPPFDRRNQHGCNSAFPRFENFAMENDSHEHIHANLG